jgi:O-antigen ligase
MISGSAVVTERLSNVSSVRFRLDLLETSQRIIRDNWLFGVGIGNFSYYFLEYGGHWETLAYDLPSPHNTFILVLSTMGLVAFVPYVLIFVTISWRMLKAIWRSRWDKRVDRPLVVSGLAVVAVYLVSAAVVDLYVSVFTSLVFFFITGTVMGHIGLLPRRKSQPSTAVKSPLSSSAGTAPSTGALE